MYYNKNKNTKREIYYNLKYLMKNIPLCNKMDMDFGRCFYAFETMFQFSNKKFIYLPSERLHMSKNFQNLYSIHY